MKKILLYSGGMDSWLIDKLWKPDVKLYVDMHTMYSKFEIDRIKECAEDVKIVNFPLGKYERSDAIIPLRNLYLLMIASNEFSEEDLEICLGSTAGDRSLDQSDQFLKESENILNFLYSPQSWIPNGRTIRVINTYKSFTKSQLLHMYLQQGGDIEEAMKSLSCYYPSEGGKECWSCKPCFRKFVAFVCNGYRFDDDIIQKNMQYIKTNIIDLVNKGSYRNPIEDAEIKLVYDRYKDYVRTK